MADRKYAVTFGGELSEGMTAARLRERLAKLPEALTAAQIDAMLAARNATLKCFADRESANHFVSELREAGMVCWLRLLHPGEQVRALLEEAQSPIAEMTSASAPSAEVAVTSARRRGLGPGAMTAVTVIVLVGSITAWYAWPHSSRHHRSASAADSAPAAESPAAASASAEQPPVPEAARPVVTASRAPTALIVPEPPLVVSAKPKPKADAPVAAEAARLEAPKADGSAQAIKTSLPAGAGVATFAPAVQAAPAPASQPAAQSPTQVAMISQRPAAPAAEVIVPPTYDLARVPQPKYPAQAYRNGDQGEVLLSVLVGSDGKPKKVTVAHSSGSMVLDRAATETVKAWQFAPGTRNGVPQEAARQVAIGFRLGE